MTIIPKITVCVPTYNRFKDLNNVIDSFLIQDYKNSELLILDDLGSKRVGEIAKKWMKKSKKIIYHKNNKNLGYTNNMRQAFTIAKGDILVFMGDDDIFIKNNSLTLFAKAFSNKNVGVAKASQILFKKGLVNQAFPLKQGHQEIIYYKNGKQTYENLWFESLSISGLAFRNVRRIRDLVSNSSTLYPQVELMGKVCLWYDCAEINMHCIGVQSHDGQLNCMYYDLDGIRTNILDDWLHIFSRINALATAERKQFMPKKQFIEKFTVFILYFFPYNTLTNGRLDTLRFVLKVIQCNKNILTISLFWSSFGISIFFPKKIISFLIEKIKMYRRNKMLEKKERIQVNTLLSRYYTNLP